MNVNHSNCIVYVILGNANRKYEVAKFKFYIISSIQDSQIKISKIIEILFKIENEVIPIGKSLQRNCFL
jgi:hypothetical protein